MIDDQQYYHGRTMDIGHYGYVRHCVGIPYMSLSQLPREEFVEVFQSEVNFLVSSISLIESLFFIVIE